MKGLQICYILPYITTVRKYINVCSFSTILTPHTSIKGACGDKVVPLEYSLMFEVCLEGLTDLVTSIVPNKGLTF